MLAAERFRRLLSDLAPDETQRAAALRAQRVVRGVLQSHFYGAFTLTDHSRAIGAWVKGTDVRPPRPVDLLFALPRALREPDHVGQAATPGSIWQAVEDALRTAGHAVRARADGQAITADVDGQIVEVRPAFAAPGGRFDVLHVRGEGGFETCDPVAEETSLRQADARSHGNARDLIRMMKCWQAFRRVPISSFAIELLAVEFLVVWPRAGDPASFYDWMVRDFLGFLAGRAGREVAVPGAGRTLATGDEWLAAARAAHGYAARACDCESEGLNADAWWEWEKIFGERVPLEP